MARFAASAALLRRGRALLAAAQRVERPGERAARRELAPAQALAQQGGDDRDRARGADGRHVVGERLAQQRLAERPGAEGVGGEDQAAEDRRPARRPGDQQGGGERHHAQPRRILARVGTGQHLHGEDQGAGRADGDQGQQGDVPAAEGGAAEQQGAEDRRRAGEADLDRVSEDVRMADVVEEREAQDQRNADAGDGAQAARGERRPSSENAACRSAPSGAVRVTILGWWQSKAGATPNEVRVSPAPGGGGNGFDGRPPPSATNHGLRGFGRAIRLIRGCAEKDPVLGRRREAHALVDGAAHRRGLEVGEAGPAPEALAHGAPGDRLGVAATAAAGTQPTQPMPATPWVR